MSEDKFTSEGSRVALRELLEIVSGKIVPLFSPDLPPKTSVVWGYRGVVRGSSRGEGVRARRVHAFGIPGGPALSGFRPPYPGTLPAPTPTPGRATTNHWCERRVWQGKEVVPRGARPGRDWSERLGGRRPDGGRRPATTRGHCSVFRPGRGDGPRPPR